MREALSKWDQMASVKEQLDVLSEFISKKHDDGIISEQDYRQILSEMSEVSWAAGIEEKEFPGEHVLLAVGRQLVTVGLVRPPLQILLGVELYGMFPLVAF